MVIMVVFRAQKGKNSAGDGNDHGNDDGNDDDDGGVSNDDDIEYESTQSGLCNDTKKSSKSDGYHGLMPSQKLSHFRARTL